MIQAQGRSNVEEAFLGIKEIQALGGRLSVDEHVSPNRTKQGLVEIKEALEELPCRDPRVESKLPQ